MRVYAVVSAWLPRKPLTFSSRPEDAERFVEEVRDDEADLAKLLSIEPIELGESTSI